VTIAPRIAHSDDTFRLATWQNVTLVEIAGNMDAPSMRRLFRAHIDLAAAYPEGIVSCTIVRPGVPVAAGDGRAEVVKSMKELGDSWLRSALVIEETGVMAQVLRTIVRGFNIVTRNTKLVMCDDIEEAVGSIAPLVVPPQSGANVRAELLAAVAEARKGYAPRPVRPVAQR
jgi:hypothetical protein